MAFNTPCSQNDSKPIEKILIIDGDNKVEADKLDQVPEKYRPVIKELLQQIGLPGLKNQQLQPRLRDKDSAPKEDREKRKD